MMMLIFHKMALESLDEEYSPFYMTRYENIMDEVLFDRKAYLPMLVVTGSIFTLDQC